MANAGTQIVCLTVLAHSICMLSAVSIQDEVVYFCLGQPQTFTCQVPKQGSLTRLEWRIDFEHSSSETSVTRLFTSTDPEERTLKDDRPGVRFVFNLTSNSPSSLVSVMTLFVDDINATALINNATINCGSRVNNEPFSAVLHIIESPHSQNLMKLTHDLMNVRWNSVPTADHYIINVSPDPQDSYNESDSESTFITSNTTIELQLQYNRDYNVSVMASNCAGNSTPAQINMRVGNCALSTSKYIEINFMNESNSGWMEGSQILFYCHSNRNKLMETTCSNNGSWNPDPLKHKCQKNYEKTDISSEVKSKLATWHVVTAIIIAFIAVVLLVIIGAVVIITVYRKHSQSQKIRLDHSNYYSDLPGSTQLVNDNQEMGIYSLLQPEEQRVTRVQSTEQTTTTLVYADVGSTLSRNPNTNANISLQLDDDLVQYADLKQHHQQPPELHQKALESNSHSDAPVDLDSLLIHLRSEVTPKWRQFGEAVGISEEVLKNYSNYPPEECIVEVFDYWLRNYPSPPTDKPTWRDVADVLIKMELHQLANGLLQGGPPVSVDMNAVPEHLLQPDLLSTDDLPPPIPPKIANLDEEMMPSDATKIQLK